MNARPFSLRAYRFATSALEPIAPFALRRRARRGKENPARLSERLGYPSRERPAGTLIWIHGVSVGECLAVLPLIEGLLAKPGRSVLMTSGTVTSAELMASRLPQGSFHQFAPVDTPAAVSRFLTHWKPDIAVFVDSEIWPNTLIAAHERGVPLALVNGRMSEKSFAGWRNARRTAAGLLTLYDFVSAQDEQSAQRFRALGASSVSVTGSLKADAPPLPMDEKSFAQLKGRIGSRPLFLATNTHDREEAILISVHDRLRERFPSLLTIIAPRHPERGEEIARLCGPRTSARRSVGDEIEDGTEIYIADTMGELGLFYRLAPFAFIGKSLMGEGGQNPIEAVRGCAAIIAGSNTDNFREAYNVIFDAQGTGRIASAEELASLVARLLESPREAQELAERAERALSTLGGALEKTRLALENILVTRARA